MRTLFVGTGSYVPPMVTNEELFNLFHQATNGTKPAQKDGELLRPEWPERYFGIKSRTLDLHHNGMSDTDLAVATAQIALTESGLSPSQIGVVIHVSPTPDKLHFQSHMTGLMQRLGLAADTHAIYLDLGCSALGPALREVQGNLLQDPHTYVLLISSQCVSPGLRDKERLSSYLKHPTEPFAWLQSGTIFSDGGAAVICKLVDDREKRGVLRVWSASNLSGTIASFKDGFYLMNGAFVRENFVPTMNMLYNRMVDEWDQYVTPVIGEPFSLERIKRWYFHQANALLIEKAVTSLKIPMERVPILVTTEGNPSSVSTLRLLDRDRKAGLIQEKDLVVFFWTGAGNGAQFGYSVVIL